MALPPLPLFPKLTAPVGHVALRVSGAELEDRELAAHAVAFAQRLGALGVPSGARVVVWANPDLATAVALVSAITAGVVLVPLNPGIGEQELAHILRDAAPACVFSSCPERDQPRTPHLPCAALSRPPLPAPTPTDVHIGPHAAEAPCLVLYTSGTTGAPKGALLCPRNIAATLDGLRAAWQLTEHDTITHALPLFHAHGLVFGWLGALRVGACLELIPKFTPEAVAEALRGPNRVLYAVPTMYHRLCDAAERDEAVRAGFAHARLLVSGSAALLTREHTRIEQLTGQRVCERYGLSETLVNTAVRSDRPRRPGYVGEPLPGVELKLVDEARSPIHARDDHTFGEIAVRGPNVFLGYLNRPDATQAVLADDGFFYTGDLGTISPDGYLRIVGRKGTDLIKTGGFKVGAGEVENALLSHPSVREAAVVGRPDADLGERIVAFVVLAHALPHPSADELSELVAHSLAKHKRPREVHFVAELPRNALGKVQKAKLP